MINHLNNSLKKLFCFALLTSAIFLSGCASTPDEEYVDYFYANKDEQGNKAFKYILSVKGSEASQSKEMGDQIITDPKQQHSNRRTSRRKSNSDDGYSTISFRMEEEAFKRIEKILADKKFCVGKIEYIENEYTWLRYSIVGRCKASN